MSIHDKIRKLLNLASNGGATEAEAATAAAMAASLMRDHEISEEAVTGRAPVSAYCEKSRRVGFRVATWRKLIGHAIVESYGVGAFTDPDAGEFVFYGDATRVAVACYAYDALVANLEEKGKIVPREKRESFLAGAAATVANRMRDEREREERAKNLPALIPPPAHRLVAGVKPQKFSPSLQSDAFRDGARAGETVCVRPGIRGDAGRLESATA